MKYLIFSIASFCFFSYCTPKQSEHISSKSEISYANVVENDNHIANDSIKCCDITVNNNIRLTNSEAQVIRFLGKPDSIFVARDEVDTPVFIYKVFVYEKSELYFFEHKLFGFMLNDAGFVVNSLKIGAKNEQIKSTYSLSYNNKLHKNNKQTVIDIHDVCHLGNKKYLSPDRLIITYDANELITQIICSTY
jgi:hypothetical protein